MVGVTGVNVTVVGGGGVGALVTAPVLWPTHRFEVGLHLSEVPLSQREAQAEGLELGETRGDARQSHK